VNLTQFITITNILLRNKGRWLHNCPNPNSKLQPVTIQIKINHVLPRIRGATKTFARLVLRKNMAIIRLRMTKLW
jgi:hypothetical protein